MDDDSVSDATIERVGEILGAKLAAWTAPATPAPADGFLTASDVALAAVLDKRAAALAPGERVSVDAAALDELDTATLRGDADLWTTEAARRVIATAAPLPAPSASAGVGAETLEEWRKLADGLQRDACSDDGPAEARAWRAACAIRAAIDALSTAAAPVRPDRAAVEALVKTIRLGIPLPGCMTGPSEPCGECRSCKAWSACAALLAIVFGDSAPSEVDRGE